MSEQNLVQRKPTQESNTDKKEQEYADRVRKYIRSLRSPPLKESISIQIIVQVITLIPIIFVAFSMYYDYLQDASFINTWIMKAFYGHACMLSVFMLILPMVIWKSVEGHRTKTFELLILLNTFVLAQAFVTAMIMASIWYSETKQKNNPNVNFFYTEIFALSNMLVATFLSRMYLPNLLTRSKKQLELLMKRFE